MTFGDPWNAITNTGLPWGGSTSGTGWFSTGASPFYNTNTTTGNIQFTPPGPPPPTYQFNIVILADGKSVRGLDQNDLATKIGLAIAAALQVKDDQHTLEDLAE